MYGKVGKGVKKIMKIPEYIIERFGKDLASIQKAKTESTQKKDVAFSPPSAVKMTVDECKSLCKNAGVQYKDGFESRVLRYTCSDESVDRMGDVIKQDGWSLENFEKNPVIMGFHDYGTYPVGNSLKTYVDEGKLKMHVLFADKEISEDADKHFRMAKSGFMKAGSVGFAPIEYKLPSDEEREELGMPQYGILFNKQELLEFSTCGVPANANAIQESIQKGVMKKEDYKSMLRKEIYDKLKDVEKASGTTSTNEGHSHPYSVNDEGNGTAAEGSSDHSHAIEANKVQETNGHTHTINKSIESAETKNNDVSEVEELATSKEILEKLDQVLELKAGAVLSKKNKTSINNAIEGMESAIGALKQLLSDAETSKPNEDDDEPEDTGKSEDSSTIDIDLDSVGAVEGDEGIYGDEDIEINI